MNELPTLNASKTLEIAHIVQFHILKYDRMWNAFHWELNKTTTQQSETSSSRVAPLSTNYSPLIMVFEAARSTVCMILFVKIFVARLLALKASLELFFFSVEWIKLIVCYDESSHLY